MNSQNSNHSNFNGNTLMIVFIKISLTLLLFMISFNVSAQSFGPDRIVSSDTTYDVNKSFISVAFNGWIYVAFNYNEIGTGFTGRVIKVSKDNGISWQTLLNVQTNPQNIVPFISMVVAGTDTTNLRIFTTATSHYNQYLSGFASVYDGLTGASITPYITLADGNTFGVTDMAICSDWKHINANSNPYSVAVVYSQYDPSGSDSVLVIYSNDGGANFSNPIFVTTSQEISNVDIAYGSFNSPIEARYSVVWEEKGHIGLSKSDIGNPLAYSSSTLMDTLYPNLSGLLHNPVISMQSSNFSNSSNDYSTVVLAERYDSSTSSNDIIGFYNHDTQNGSFGFAAVLDSASDNTIQPSVCYDEVNENFIATWYNQTTRELPCLYLDKNFPGSWISLTSNYADTSKFDSPFPVICVNDLWNEINVCWIQESDTADLFNSRGILKYDVTALPLIIPSLQSSDKFKVGSSVTSSSFSVSIGKELLQSSAIFEIFNSLSKRIYSEKIYFSNEDFNKTYNLGLARGVYFLRFNDGKKMFTQKIIIQ